MIIIPAIDLPDPDRPPPPRPIRDLIHECEWLGFRCIHLGEPERTAGSPSRGQAGELLRDSHHHIDAQVAGDIHSGDDIEDLVNAGARRVVLGARALDETEWLTSTISTFPDVLVVRTPARERRIRSRGWLRTLPVDLRDLAQEIVDLPLAGFIVSLADDAAIDHRDLAIIEDLSEMLPFPLMVEGGIQSLASLRDLEFRGVQATIIGMDRLSLTADEQTLARDFVD